MANRTAGKVIAGGDGRREAGRKWGIKLEVTFIDSLTIKSVQKGLVCQNEIH